MMYNLFQMCIWNHTNSGVPKPSSVYGLYVSNGIIFTDELSLKLIFKAQCIIGLLSSSSSSSLLLLLSSLSSSSVVVVVESSSSSSSGGSSKKEPLRCHSCVSISCTE